MQFDIKELKADGLIQYTTQDERWYYKVINEIGRMLPSVSWITGYCPKGKGYEMFLKNKGAEADEVRDQAADRGSKIHQAIDQLLQTGKLVHDDKFLNSFNDRMEELNADQYSAVLSYLSFLREYKIKKEDIILIEQVVVNEEIGYAGTLDQFIKIGEEYWLIDVKTGKGVYLSHRAQVSAYRRTTLITEWAKQLGIDPMSIKLGILQVGYRNKAGFKLTEVDDEFDTFMHAYAFWQKDNDDSHPHQVSLPQVVNMEEVWVGNEVKEETSSKSPAESLEEKSTDKPQRKRRTRATSATSSDSPTSITEKKVTKSKSRSRKGRKTSKSNSPLTDGSASPSSKESGTSTSEKSSPSA